jgi:hypothetical protein
MKDMIEHLRVLREQIEKCEQPQRTSKSKIKRAIFGRLVDYYRVLARELERAISAQAEEDGKRSRP